MTGMAAKHRDRWKDCRSYKLSCRVTVPVKRLSLNA